MPKPMDVYYSINGKTQRAKDSIIPPDNAAFRAGMGLIETVLWQYDALQLWDQHFERLSQGMVALHLKMPAHTNQKSLEKEIIHLIKQNNITASARVRIQFFGGGGGIFSDAALQAQYIIEVYTIEERLPYLNEHGLCVGFAEGLEKCHNSISHLKTANGLVYAQAAIQARQQRCNDMMISNNNGHIIESSIANLFWVKDKTIYTPPLTDGCVGGVFRAFLLQKYPEIKLQSVDKDTLKAADEVFLANAIRRIKWIVDLDGTPLKNSMTYMLASEVQKYFSGL